MNLQHRKNNNLLINLYSYIAIFYLLQYEGLELEDVLFLKRRNIILRENHFFISLNSKRIEVTDRLCQESFKQLLNKEKIEENDYLFLI